MVDRYYYNYYLDPVSVKYYGSPWLVERLSRFFPRPDLVVIFRAPIEVLLARKQELSSEEISRQNAALSQIAFRAGNILQIDSAQPAVATAGAVLAKLGAL